MTEQITVGGQTVTRVLLPDEVIHPDGTKRLWPDADAPTPVWFRSVDEAISDAVAIQSSPFTGTNAQRFEWPGAETWTGTMTLPPMTPHEEAVWRAALMQCRGMLNPFLLGDERHMHPSGSLDGRSKPVCDTATPATDNLPQSKFLRLRGLVPNAARLALAGDHLDVGYRLYTLVDNMNTDASGEAVVEVWPSLREQPANGSAVNFNRPRGLFCLSTNQRTWSYDVIRFSSMSFSVMEWR